MEATRPAAGFVPSARVAVRVLTVALLAGLVAVVAHLAGGGSLPLTGAALAGVAGVAGPVTFLAQALATRYRSTWRAFLALASGQLVIELVLQANDRAVEGPLTTIAVHLLANAALGVMLVGTDRARADLASALDRVLPPFDTTPGSVKPHGRLFVAVRRDALAPSCAISSRTLRGPPRHLGLS